MALPEKTKNIISLFVRIGLSGLLLWYLFSKIDTEETFVLVKSADLKVLGIAFGIFVMINFVLLFRWFIIIKALDLNVSYWNVFRYFFIGLFGNLFLPSSIGGDIIKMIGLARHSDTKPRVVASVLLDRLSGFTGIVIVAICSYTFGYKLINDHTILLFIFLLLFGSLSVALVLFNEKIYSFCTKVFAWLPKFKDKLMEMHHDISLLKTRPIQGYKAIAISCCTQVVFALCFFFIAKALGEDIRFIYFLVFVPMICIASSFPSIGGLGVREFGAAFLFAKVGVAEEIAVGMSLISFLFMVLMGLLGGVIYVFTVDSRRIQHHSQHRI